MRGAGGDRRTTGRHSSSATSSSSAGRARVRPNTTTLNCPPSATEAAVVSAPFAGHAHSFRRARACLLVSCQTGGQTRRRCAFITRRSHYSFPSHLSLRERRSLIHVRSMAITRRAAIATNEQWRNFHRRASWAGGVAPLPLSLPPRGDLLSSKSFLPSPSLPFLRSLRHVIKN